MTKILETVARARDNRRHAETRFRETLAEAHRYHSWREIAEVAGLSPAAVRYLVGRLPENTRSEERRPE